MDLKGMGCASFLGLTNYFEGIPQICAGPGLLFGGNYFAAQGCRLVCRWSFDGVRMALTANIFVMPEYTTPSELIADACNFGFGAALLQEGRPIA